MKEKIYLAKWRSTKTEQRYRELDGELWQRDLTGAAPEAIDVPTSFGATRAYHWPGDGPPVIFLHGFGDSSVRWIPFAEQLDGHNIYAIDIMGDVGASTPSVGFTSASDYADWLHETVTGLGLSDPIVVGHSLGGYLALSYAMTYPVTSTIAIDPVGVVKLRLARFMSMGLAGLMASLSPAPVRRFLAKRQRHPLLADKLGLQVYVYGQRNHPPKLPPLPVFTDDELASISTPLRVLVGAETFVFDVEQLVERVNTLVPQAEATLLPDAGHALTMTHFDECLAVIRSVLTPSRNG